MLTRLYPRHFGVGIRICAFAVLHPVGSNDTTESGRHSGGRARFRWRSFLCSARPRGCMDDPRRSRVAGARPTRPTARLVGPGHHQEAYTPARRLPHNAAIRRLAAVLWISRPAWRRGAPRASPTSHTHRYLGRTTPRKGTNVRICTLPDANMARWRRSAAGLCGRTGETKVFSARQGWAQICGEGN